MAERLVYYVPSGVATEEGFNFGDPTMLGDLKLVSRLSDDSINELSQKLSEMTGFLSTRRLASAVAEVTNDEATANALFRALRSLSPDGVNGLLEGLNEQLPAIDLQRSEFESLGRKLPKLIQPYPALQRFEKAEYLAVATGQRLESLELICDLRPVFDETRERVEGLLPFTRFRLVAIGTGGIPSSFEVELSAQQVRELADKATKAEKKLSALRASAKEWVIDGLPDVPLTRPPRKRTANGKS